MIWPVLSVHQKNFDKTKSLEHWNKKVYFSQFSIAKNDVQGFYFKFRDELLITLTKQQLNCLLFCHLCM